MILDQKGFSYIELMIMISFLTLLIGYLLNILYVTQREKEEQRDQLVLQHSYQTGYNYLRNRITNTIRFLGGGKNLYIESKNKREVFRSYGSKVIREVSYGQSDLDGTVIVFEYIDSIQFEILPNDKGVHFYGRLKLNQQIFLFDDVILKRSK